MEKKKFVFGTQYLRGASPERDVWEKDLYNIRKNGFNTIRAWLVWNTIERSEGVFDYDYLSTFLELAKKNDLEVGLLFHMHACPEWAVKKYPHYFYEDERQIPFQPAVRPNTPGGGWPGLCFDNPEVREIERRFIEGVIAETKKHDCVSFYEPMNEPHQWNNYVNPYASITCYCDASVKRFREWLAKKYSDIKTLNDSWGHFYNDFDEIRPPRWTPSFADYADFRLFTIDNIRDEIKYRSEIIKSCDNKPVIAHAWGGGSVTCANLGGMAFDDWKNAQVFDKWGYSAFPKAASDCATLGMGCDATRCAAGGKEFWQSELTAGSNGTGLSITGRVDVNTFDKFCLESIRHGATGLLYWQYRSERFGNEWGGYSFTDYNGDATELSERAGELCRAVTAHEDYFLNGTQKPAEVALVFSLRSFLADWANTQERKNKFAVDSISGYYKIFWEENITADIIHESFAPELSRYKLIILPSPYAISESFSAKLKEYIKNGGTVISDPFYGAFEETFKRSYHIPGHGFEEVFGCTARDMRQRKEVTLTDGKESYTLKGTQQFEVFKVPDGNVLYTTTNGEPAIISNKFGKGRAIISATNLGLSYSDRSLIADDIHSYDTANKSIFARDFVLKVANEAGVTPNICTANGVKVSVIRGQNGLSYMAILINSTLEEATGTIEIGEKISDVRVIFGNAVCKATKSGIDFSLNPEESCIMVLEK
ncbi:MAG: hypothetical protein E7588_08975 [Ruminococcaceae bacterium]|nr:hypothetical protein [Oscillospiraceae bacterium]